MLREDMACEPSEVVGVIARSVGGEAAAVGQKLEMPGAEIHIHDMMVACAEARAKESRLALASRSSVVRRRSEMSTTCAGSLFSQRSPETETSQTLEGRVFMQGGEASPPPRFATGQRGQMSDLPKHLKAGCPRSWHWGTRGRPYR